jgi:hypothetical protein
VVLVDGGSGDLSAADAAFDRDDLGRVRVRRCLVSALVGAVGVEVVFVGGKDLAGVGFADQYDVVGAFCSG